MTAYFRTLYELLEGVVVTNSDGETVPYGVFASDIRTLMHQVTDLGGRMFFIGNGGSASIASHMAEDYMKAGGVRAQALNDVAMLTCLANDFGYKQVFSKQLEMYARSNDILVAISSSGSSENILQAVATAKNIGCRIVTLSGFHRDNPLRLMGDYNVYIDAAAYGFVEIAHLAILHEILDIDVARRNVR